MTPIERLALHGESEALATLLEQLPIFATRVGYRTDSTPLERRVGDAAFAAARAFNEAMEASR